MHILLAYAAADGREPATRLAELLRTLGLTVADATEAAAAAQGAAVIAVLTPAAPADRGVLAALEGAAAQGRPLLPLSAPAPSAFPTAADLARILEWRAVAAAQPAPAQGAKYQVIHAVNSSIGDNVVTVNIFGPAAGWSAAETAGFVAALHNRQPGAPISAQELRNLFADLQAQVQQVRRDMQQGFTRVLGRFDLAEQRILAPILVRLDEQQVAQITAILDALETHAFPADELGRRLAVIQMALAEINVRAAQIRDRQLVESARQVVELASAPGLEVKHKLKIAIPILPLLVAYEGELELGSRLNLGEAWRGVRGWIGGKRQTLT